MKTYQKTSDGSLWGFEEDGSQDHLITEDMVLLTDAQVDAIRNPPPAPEQLVALNVLSAFAAGLKVTSTSTPAINGTYPLDPVTQQEITSVTIFALVNGDFPGGTSTYPWTDVSGIPHIFPSVAVFDEWATAIANQVAAIKLYGAGAPGAELPPASITIA
jgi:hypothetical protein